ncbi:MAG: D-tagatose 3-epimerase [Firmicutes bacterium ADurb.Bin506]|nr:MAG: D-tagatose 3-epimerase [Firmicutes bacterium ADurb.Bin506]
MRLSCCWIYAIGKYGYPPSFDDTVQALRDMKALGFRYVELEGVGRDNMMEVHARRRELKRAVDDMGLKVVNFCPILPELVSPDRAVRDRAIDLFKLGVEVAHDFDALTVQTDSFVPPLKFVGDQLYKTMVDYGIHFSVQVDPAFSWERQWEALVDAFSRCSDIAADAGLKFCLEPRVGEQIANSDALLRLMDACSRPNFGAVLDTAHLHAQKEILPLSVEKLGKKIFYLHVADNNGMQNDHLAVGRGTVDWEGVFSALAKHGFDGCVAIDVGRVPDLEAQVLESVGYLVALCARLGLELER